MEWYANARNQNLKHDILIHVQRYSRIITSSHTQQQNYYLHILIFATIIYELDVHG